MCGEGLVYVRGGHGNRRRHRPVPSELIKSRYRRTTIRICSENASFKMPLSEYHYTPQERIREKGEGEKGEITVRHQVLDSSKPQSLKGPRPASKPHSLEASKPQSILKASKPQSLKASASKPQRLKASTPQSLIASKPRSQKA